MWTSNSRATSFLIRSSYETDIIQVTFCAKSATLYEYRRREFRIIDRCYWRCDGKLVGKARRLRGGSDRQSRMRRTIYHLLCIKLTVIYIITRREICVLTDQIVRSGVTACTNNTPPSTPPPPFSLAES